MRSHLERSTGYKLRLAWVSSAAVPFFRRISTGIMAYARAEPGVELLRHELEPMLTPEEAWNLGADAWVVCETPHLLEVWRKAGCPPAVNISNRLRTRVLPSVLNDEARIGTLAWEWLGALQAASHACIARSDMWFTWQRCVGMRRAARGAGRRVESYVLPGWDSKAGEVDTFFEGRAERLADWLATLPRPAAVFAATDAIGAQCLELARRRGWRVPGDLYVVGCDNLAQLAEYADFGLSSVNPAAEELGYRAAQLAVELARGRAAPLAGPVLVPPREVVEHGSTRLPTEDAAVRRVLRRMEASLRDAPGVVELAREVGLSRRALELRFQRALGRSPHDTLNGLRLDLARDRLARGQASMDAIAEECGFANAKNFAVAFKKRYRMTPSEYRKIHGRAGGGRIP